MLEEIYEQFPEEDFLTADGLGEAVIGVEEKSMRLIYSAAKIVDILRQRNSMTIDEAIEFYSYNIEGAYMGEKTPIFVYDLF